jgi:hypothetical protein
VTPIISIPDLSDASSLVAVEATLNQSDAGVVAPLPLQLLPHRFHHQFSTATTTETAGCGRKRRSCARKSLVFPPEENTMLGSTTATARASTTCHHARMGVSVRKVDWDKLLLLVLPVWESLKRRPLESTANARRLYWFIVREAFHLF